MKPMFLLPVFLTVACAPLSAEEPAPSNSVADPLPTLDFVVRGFIGVVIPSAAAPVPGGDFRTIVQVVRGSPAEMAGVRAGDSILAVDGKPTASMKESLELVRALARGARFRRSPRAEKSRRRAERNTLDRSKIATVRIRFSKMNRTSLE